jgi:hypothetical protein
MSWLPAIYRGCAGKMGNLVMVRYAASIIWLTVAGLLIGLASFDGMVPAALVVGPLGLAWVLLQFAGSDRLGRVRENRLG